MSHYILIFILIFYSEYFLFHFVASESLFLPLPEIIESL